MKSVCFILIATSLLSNFHYPAIGNNHLDINLNDAINQKIRDTVSYTNNKISIWNFMVSPVDKNKIWVFTDFDSYELNLEDSSWTNLSYRFGHFSRNLRKERIYKDDQQKNLLWVINRQLICYDLKTGKYSEFPDIYNVTSLCFLNDYVMIGTLDGMYRYTRAGGRMGRIEGIPLLSVNNIQKIDENLILINNKYEYNNESNVLNIKYLDQQNVSGIKIIDDIEITTGYNSFTINTGDTLVKFNYAMSGVDNIISDPENIWIFPHDLMNNILQYSRRDHLFHTYQAGYHRYYMTTFADKAGIWIYNDLSLLYFDKKDHSVRFIISDSSSTFRNLIAMDEYIISNTEHRVKLYSKDFLLANSISLEKIIFEENEFEKDKKSFYESRDYLEKYKIFRYLVESYGASVNPMIRQEIMNIKWYFITDSPYKPEELKDFIDNNLVMIKEDDIRAALFLKLVNLYIWEGKLDKALETDSLLMNDYPVYRDQYYRLKMEKVSQSNLEIKKIMSSQVKEDEILWKTGNEYYNLFHYAGRETEAGIDMTYPFQYFHNLVDKFPDSQYADDAAFIMLQYNMELSDEGGDSSYNLEAIGEYQSILTNYPGTEYTPEIYYIIGGLFNWCHADYYIMKGYLEQALIYLQKIKDEFPEFDKIHEVMSLMDHINQDIPRYEWELFLISNKNQYSLDEPIVLTFRLTNHAEFSQPVKLYESLLMPNFELDITLFPDEPQTEYGKNVPFEEDIRDFDQSRKTMTIKPNEFYEEKWNIRENAWEQYGNAPGYFNLTQPGSYRISAYLPEEEDLLIPSNTIWIKIK